MNHQEADKTDMPMKCAMRAPWKLPNSAVSPENCTGFQIARPVTTCMIPARITTM